MGRRHEQTFLQKTYRWPTHMKRCSLSHQENENQNYSEIITSHLSEGLKSTTEETTGVGEDVEKK